MELPKKHFFIKKGDEKKMFCDEVYEKLNRKLSYSQIRKWVNENGVQCVRECFIESKGQTGLFIWMMNKYKTKLNENL